VLRISVDGSGTVTLTQYAQIDHLPEDVDATNDNGNVALGSGLVTLSATATTVDFDNDTATANVSVDLGGNLSFDDDVPSVTASAVADGAITLTTQDAQTVGLASDSASASFAAAFLAAASGGAGADAPASTTVSGYSLAITNINSGLTSGGLAITLSMDGSDVVGSTSAGAVFRISVDGSGTVTLTQYAQIDHLPEDVDASNDNANVALGSGLVTLSATATTVDFDNDTATAVVSVDLGGNLSFDDDVPTVTASAVADGAVTLTTQDAQTVGLASDSASASFAAVFLAAAAPVYGADGPGSTTISGFSLAITNVNSGLTSGGLAITLSMDGSDVVGFTSAGAVFRISVDGSGTVTLTQYTQIDHLPEDVDATNDNANMALGSGLVTLSATATTVDFDNDTATAVVSVDLGGNLSFDDDVPSVTASAVADGSITLTTQDAQTVGVASDSASASFAAAFLDAATPVYGADGAGSTSISGYTLAVTNANAGLTSGGLAITLTMDGSDVVGSTTSGAVFRISVDGSGTVTLTQYAQIDHLPEDVDATNDNGNVALGSGLVTLSATATTVDFDNDTATANVSVDLGGNLSFDDDVPSITASAVADGAIVLTTQDAQTIGVASDSASASFAAAFLAAAAPVYGADGAGSTSISGYTLTVTNVNSGLTSGGLAITLTMDGSDVVGSTTSGAVFRISVDGSGTVTLTQYAQIDHLPEDVDATNDNANVALGSGLVTLSATATTVDFDNDTATATVSVDLGGNLSFDDDVPSVQAKTDLIYANANNPSPGGTGIFDYSIGADSRTSFSSSNSDFSAITLTGLVGAVAISSQSVAWASEDANQAVFNVQFSYAANPLTPGVLTQANGTLTFDKIGGTYQLALDEPINSFSVLTTSGTVSKQSFNIVGSSDAQPEIVVSKLADQFYVRFTGGEEQGGGGIEFKSSDGTTGFNNGETIVGAQAWVSISGNANGVASDTLQAGEVLNMDFYTSSPGNAANPGAGTATTDGIYLKLSQLGNGEDFVVILKLVDASNPAITTTKAIVVDYADIYLSSQSNPYGITFADGSDGVVIIESNDYNSGGSNWVVNGVQLLTSTESITGSGIDLNRVTGTSGGSGGTETFGGDTVDSDVIKISDIGFISTATGTQDASLSFTFNLVDADGDTTAAQSLNVTIEAGSTFTGTASAESIQAGAGNDTLAGAGGADIFKWALADQGTTATPSADKINDFTVGTGGDALDLRDLLQGELAGTDLAAATNLDQYLHFTEVGGKAVLQVDHDAGSFAPTQTITFDNMSLAQLTTSLGLSSPATDLQIIQQMLAQDNLRNSA
jgi:predicted RNA-binding protein with TRAM domain